MKLMNIAASGTLALFLLAGCEMKDELIGNASGYLPQGALELGIAVKQPLSQTRAANVSTENFPVIIQGTSTDVTDVKMEYATASELPTSIKLPVGTYNVSSHTPGEIQRQMNEPYYSGENAMTITKDITTQHTVTCKMKNSRIQMVYGEDFRNAFTSWSITVDDGNNHVLSYDQTNLNPAAIYWYFTENTVTDINVNIRAVTNMGNTISESRIFRKADAIEGYDNVNEYFEGGDAIEIHMGAVEVSAGNVTGITINTFITFEDHEEQVEIPVLPDEEGPIDPVDGVPTLSCTDDKGENLFEKGITISSGNTGEWPAKTDVIINTPKGLKSLKVTIDAGNEGFQGIVDDMGFVERNLVGDIELGGLLEGLGVILPMPEANSASYTFPIATFYPMLNLYGPTVDADQVDYAPDGKECHTFIIIVEDNEGNKSEQVKLKVTITK